MGCSSFKNDLLFNKGDSVFKVYSIDASSHMHGGTAFQVRANSGTNFLVTNAHVCKSLPSTFIRYENSYHNGFSSVVKIDEDHDLCLLKAADKAPPLEVHVGPLRTGQEIGFIGFPGVQYEGVGFGNYLGKDELNSLCPLIGCTDLGEVLHTNIPVIPGASGSPLFNTDEQVVGVIFAINSRYMNWSFAINSKYLQNLLDKN